MADMAKLAYRPIGLAVSLGSAAVAGRVVGLIWKKLADEDEIPDALDAHHDTPWLVTGVTGSAAALETLLPSSRPCCSATGESATRRSCESSSRRVRTTASRPGTA